MENPLRLLPINGQRSGEKRKKRTEVTKIAQQFKRFL